MVVSDNHVSGPTLIVANAAMQGNRSSRLYRRIRRYVDRDLVLSATPASPDWGFLPLALVLLLEASVRSPAMLALTVLTGGLALSWTGFVSWRGLRLMKAAALRHDRGFDQRGKFRLAAVYWLSESVTRTRSRRRVEARRRRD